MPARTGTDTRVALLRTIGARGLRGTSRAVADRIEEWILQRYFEWRLGIATTGSLSREALGYRHPDFSHYDASTYGNIRRIIKAVGVRPGTDVLLDYGSGKGRVLIMAAMHPFARIIGVERSSSLNEVSRQNIARVRPRLRCARIALVTADASAYDVPDDVTVVYFASPFGGRTLDAVLDRLRDSLIRAPRRIRVVSHGYDAANPFEQQVRACDWLQLHVEVLLQRSNCAWIYENCRWNVATTAPAT